jgi:hypothetical protein
LQSKSLYPQALLLSEFGWVAEWLCSGLQSRGRRFDSDPSLQKLNRLRSEAVFLWLTSINNQ